MAHKKTVPISNPKKVTGKIKAANKTKRGQGKTGFRRNDQSPGYKTLQATTPMNWSCFPNTPIGLATTLSDIDIKRIIASQARSRPCKNGYRSPSRS